MIAALSKESGEIDIHHAGTAMRFLTAYFASKPGAEVILTGSSRMQERPIKILVNALKNMGAKISYLKQEGYPPLEIKGVALHGKEVGLPGNVSSQYITALLLSAPRLPHGLHIKLETELTSVPYVEMTLSLLKQIGVKTIFEKDSIQIEPLTHIPKTKLAVESDWSSASYFYSIVALSPPGTEIELSTFRKNSLQGDSALATIYRDFGVETTFKEDSIVLIKINEPNDQIVKYNLVDTPDLAQTIAVSCLGLGMGCELTGLHTLKIKETDRLEALEREISKFGADISSTDRSLKLSSIKNLNEGIKVATYNDHRMAMAFAPLALKCNLTILDAGVVSKSYPDFWNDLQSLGLSIEEHRI